MPEAYIRGNTIKYLRVPDEVIDKVRDDSYNRAGDMRLALSFAYYLIHSQGLCWDGKLQKAQWVALHAEKRPIGNIRGRGRGRGGAGRGDGPGGRGGARGAGPVGRGEGFASNRGNHMHKHFHMCISAPVEKCLSAPDEECLPAPNERCFVQNVLPVFCLYSQ